MAATIVDRMKQPVAAKQRSSALQAHTNRSSTNDTVMTTTWWFPSLSRDPWPPNRTTTLTAPLGARSYTRLRLQAYVIRSYFRRST